MGAEASEGREGETLRGKYRLEKLLGAGGMGEVYRATNLGIGRTVAIKLLRPEFADRPSIVERFLREARAANVVRHRNVVDVLDIDKDERGTPFIVQEYLEGEDFSAMLERFPDGVPPGIALSVLGPIVDAVRVAHEKGLVHRDLKPENVFLARLDGVTVPKVLDFGISKLPRTDASVRLTGTHAIMGSPQYMSPEQILTPQQVDARSDIWSLGVMLFECLSGRLPFEGKTAEILFVKICHDEPLSLRDVAPHVPEELVHVVDRCLQREPQARFPDATELSDALKQLRRSGKWAESSLRPAGERGPVKPETMIGRTDTRPRGSGATGAVRAKAGTEPLDPTVLAPPEADSIPPPRRRPAASGPLPPGARTRQEPARAVADDETAHEFENDAPAPSSNRVPPARGAATVPDRSRGATRDSLAAQNAPGIPGASRAPNTGGTLRGEARNLSGPRMISAVADAGGPVPTTATVASRTPSGVRAPARPSRPDIRVASEMEPTQSSRPVVANAAQPGVALSPPGGAFDVGGMIEGFQAALLVVALSLFAPRFGGDGLAATRVELGGNFTVALLVVGGVLAVLGARVGLLARRVEAYSLYLASAGLFVSAASAVLLAITPDEPNAMPAIGPAVAPWAIVGVALSFAVFGFRRAQEEFMGGRYQARAVYGAFLLVLSLGGLLAAYRVSRVAIGLM
jgi:serine/threonine-protein kinase